MISFSNDNLSNRIEAGARLHNFLGDWINELEGRGNRYDRVLREIDETDYSAADARKFDLPYFVECHLIKVTFSYPSQRSPAEELWQEQGQLGDKRTSSRTT